MARVSLVKREGLLHVLDSDKGALTEWKKSISEGQVVFADFSTEPEDTSAAAARYFHLMRDAYAAVMGYTKAYAKDELCVGFGVAMPLDNALQDIPTWPGHLIDVWGKRYIRKSITAYTKKELSALIEGVILACAENGVEIGDIAGDYRRWQRQGGQDANGTA